LRRWKKKWIRYKTNILVTKKDDVYDELNKIKEEYEHKEHKW